MRYVGGPFVLFRQYIPLSLFPNSFVHENHDLIVDMCFNFGTWLEPHYSGEHVLCCPKA